jgi:hypothetical protein
MKNIELIPESEMMSDYQEVKDGGLPEAVKWIEKIGKRLSKHAVKFEVACDTVWSDDGKTPIGSAWWIYVNGDVTHDVGGDDIVDVVKKAILHFDEHPFSINVE